MRKKIAIRTDGNSVLGLGHIMRCCSIAAALRRQGAECLFIAADTDSAAAVKERGFDVCVLDSAWKDLEQEIEKMEELLRKEKPGLLLVDSYYVSERYLGTLREHIKTVYLTGMNSFCYPVDILINYHIYAEELGYEKQYGQETKLILGAQYAPLREEFSLPVTYHAEKASIFITTGGTDPYQVIPCLLKLLSETQCRDWEYHVILGKYFTEDENNALRELEGRFPHLYLYQNVRNMAEIMRKCSIAVSAAGSTLYELCACQVPTVTFAFADNQLFPAEAFFHQGIMESAGDIRQEFSQKIEKLKEGILYYAQSTERRIEASGRMKLAADGKGADRLADLLIEECLER